MDEFQVSAPGRVCLFGEHQDYLGLSVVPSAIDMRTEITCRDIGTGGDEITVNALDLGKVIPVKLTGELNPDHPDAAYFQAGIKVFEKQGLLDKLEPFTCDVTSQIPIKSGLSSSAALLVAWIQALGKIAGKNLPPAEVGMAAYQAEHDVMGIPCGMMDQLSSAIGGIIHLECVEPPVITPLDARIEGLVVADTKIRKSTSNVHSVRVRETNAGLDHLRELVEFDLKTTPFEKVEPHLKELDEIERNRLVAVFKDRDITARSLALLREKPLDYQRIGKLLNEHQMYLRDHFEVSVEKIDTIIENSIDHGAIGGKLTGAGLGGSIILLAPGAEDQVCEAIQESDGTPYKVSVDRGVL